MAACAGLSAAICSPYAGAGDLSPLEQSLLQEARSLQSAGGAKLVEGDAVGAIADLRAAWDLLDGAEAHPLQVRRAKIACKLGAAWLTAAEPMQADAWYGRCAEDAQRTERGDVHNRALVGRAVTLRTLGRADEALEAIEVAWAIPDSEFRNEPERRGMLLFQRGRTLDQLSRPDEALEAYSDASAELEWAIDASDQSPMDRSDAMTRRAPEARRFYVASRAGIASITGRLGHPAAAASDLVAILQHPDAMLPTDYTANAAQAAGFALEAADWTTASRMYEEARSSLELVGPERDRPRVERIAGRLLIAQGDLDGGCDQLQTAWELAQAADQLQGAVGLLTAIAGCRYDQGRLDDAGAAANQAVALARQEGDAGLWSALWRRARVRAASGALPDAMVDYRGALDGLDEQVAALRLDELQLGLSADAADLYDEAAAAALTIGGPDAAEEALAIMERARARLLLAAVLGIDADPEATAAPIAPSGEWPLPAPGEAIGRTLRGGAMLRGLRGEAWDAEASARRAGLRPTGERVERVLRQQLTPDHARIAGASAVVDVAIIRDRLPDDLAVVSYRVGEDGVDVFVTRRAGTWHARLSAGRADVDTLVRGLLRAVSPTGRGPGRPADAQAAADRAGSALLLPVEEHLAGAAAVVFVPDGNLYRLPFAALRLHDRWLAERFTVGVAPSLNVLDALLERPAGARATFVGVADPLGNLPAARTEGADAAGRFPDPLVLTGPDAHPEAVADGLTRGDVMHIAAHGHLLSRNAPAFLELAGADGGSRPLTADAILQLRVEASLVVLSACQSAVGDQRGGEALINSLARSFLAAGASSVIGSLWDVDDGGTAALMAAFYDGLEEGRGPASALASAQATMASAEGDATLSHPWFWAGFVAVGDPR